MQRNQTRIIAFWKTLLFQRIDKIIVAYRYIFCKYIAGQLFSILFTVHLIPEATIIRRCFSDDIDAISYSQFCN